MRGGHESGLYFREICQLLWPPPAEIRLGAPAAGQPGPQSPGPSEASEFMLIPSGARPPLLVPAKPRLAAAAIRHRSPPRARQARLVRRALMIGLASGLGGTVVRGRMQVTGPPRADTIESYLRAAVSPDIQVSMYLGPARANRKPVLQLLSPAGDAVGFAKIGVNRLTRQLVRRENAALRQLGQVGLSQVKVATVLHHGEWHGLEILVLTAIPVWQRRTPVPGTRLAAAMSEVARVGGLTSGPLATSPYFQDLRARLASADDSPDRAELQKALDVLLQACGDAELTYGSWHGDWSPWNMANTGDGLLVWDWERFAGDVPVGFDALHYWLQREIVPRARGPLAAATECPARAAQLIAPLGVGTAHARLTAVLYLAELGTRYLVDRQAEAGALFGAIGTWLVPVIWSEVAQLAPQTPCDT